MRLYTDNKGAWAGTQSDAKEIKGEVHQFDVPTDKPNLLSFLNQNSVGNTKDWAKTVTHIDERIREETKHPQSCSVNDLSAYDVRDVVLNCDKKHLGSALASIVSRLYDMQEYV